MGVINNLKDLVIKGDWNLGKGVFSIGFPKDIELQLYYPRLTSNSYGWIFLAKSCLAIGKRAFAISFFGFGVGIAQDNFNTCQRRDNVAERIKRSAQVSEQGKK